MAALLPTQNATISLHQSQRSSFTAKISPTYPFVTDLHKRWLPKVPSPRPLPTTSHFTSPNSDADFVLFPPAADHHPTHHDARRQTERVPVTSRIAPNLRIGSTFNGQQQLHRRYSTQQSPSGSPLQNPRVNDLIGLTSTASSTSPKSSPIGNSPQTRDLYSSSAPSSSISLHQSLPPTRPQVPLFSSNSTGSLRISGPRDKFRHSLPAGSYSRGTSASSSELTGASEVSQTPGPPKNMSGFSFPSGSYPPATSSSSELTAPSEEFPPEAMSFHNQPDFALMPDMSPQGSYYGSTDLASGLAQLASLFPTSASNSVPNASPMENSHDFMADMSAPPSTAYTNLTTPGSSYMESFGFDSADTSPIFPDHPGPDPDHWDSLVFPELPELPVTATETPNQPANEAVAPNMSRNESSGSSSGQSSSRQSNQGNHSNGSSPGQSSSRKSRQSNKGNHSNASGVRPNRRDKPLPVIEVDPNDAAALRRARNTMAARKSRGRKVERTEQLLRTISTLEKEVEHWKGIALARSYVEE